MVGRNWALPLLFSLVMPNVLSAAHTGTHRPQVMRDIEYARVGAASLRMDASLPAMSQNAPAVVLVHGGGWVRGDRRVDVQPLFKPLSDAGFAWFSITYRLATDMTQFGVAISDVQDAVRYVRSHAATFNIDPDKIALIGESAGGQLAAMAALRGRGDTAVKAVVAFYAPSDLVSLINSSNYVPAQIRACMRGTPWGNLFMAGLSQLSPIDNVRHDMPPFLLIHGTADGLVPFRQSTEMCERMKKAGASCELYPVAGAGHGIWLWESAPQLASAYKHKMLTWLGQQLRSGATVSP
jgi:acetyl esterase